MMASRFVSSVPQKRLGASFGLLGAAGLTAGELSGPFARQMRRIPPFAAIAMQKYAKSIPFPYT
jgi:hypothetical protein